MMQRCLLAFVGTGYVLQGRDPMRTLFAGVDRSGVQGRSNIRKQVPATNGTATLNGHLFAATARSDGARGLPALCRNGPCPWRPL